MHVDDSELIDRVLSSNDNVAFAELVNRYQKLVYTTCRGFFQSDADVEDLVQDVFVEMYQSLATFRHQSKLSTWLYRVAVNKSLNHLRKKKRQALVHKMPFWSKDDNQERQYDHAAPNSANADYALASNENRLILKAAIAKLPENQRVAFVLSKYHELSYKEIAEVMEVSVSSVESLIFRAKTNLRKQFSTKL